jgi:hypothetical protein
MGYANGQLGDITSLLRSRGFNVPATTTTPAAPVSVPLRIAPVTPITSLPMVQAILRPATAPLTSPTVAQTVQKMAPVVAPVMGPAGALLAPFTEALQQPPTVKVRVMAPPVLLAPSAETPSPAAAPSVAPANGGSSGTVYNADGSPANGAPSSAVVNQADVTDGGGAPDLLGSIRKLPPVALAVVAVGAFVLFNRR